MSLYGRVVAAGYDAFMAAPERAVLRHHRSRLLRQARGRVLEIGGGTGANLPFYPPAVEELVITEPDEAMARKLEANVAQSTLPARVVRTPAESLPPDARDFDFVVSTLVLCTVNDPARSLSEIDRVLKPNGELLFLEHVRSEDVRLAHWQDRLDRAWLGLGHGCHANRKTLEMVQGASFTITELEHDELRKTLPIVRPLVVGVATKAVRVVASAMHDRTILASA
jgi:SAM-dependent methyltransferase